MKELMLYRSFAVWCVWAVTVTYALAVSAHSVYVRRVDKFKKGDE